MIVKGRELVRFVSTLSQFLLFSSSSLPYSFYSFPLFLSFSSFFPVYYTYIYSRPQKFSHEIDKGAIFKLKKKKKRSTARYSRFEIWDDQRETYFLRVRTSAKRFSRSNWCALCERGDELFAVIKETRPTNAIRSLAILLKRPCV